jgi:N-acetylneuraminic acid mutarotase
MIVWGGYDYTNSFYPTFLADGARYNPSNDTWTPLPSLVVPPRRAGHTAVWTGKEMLIWGGYSHSGGISPTFSYFNQGFAYNLESNSWRVLPSSGLSARRGQSAVWNGEEMFIWGGAGSGGMTNNGARYQPLSNTWSTITSSNAPNARSGHSAVWSDYRMIVWGGLGAAGYFNSGAMFDPYLNTWTAMTNSMPVGRDRHGAVWAGGEMMIVNGANSGGDLGDGPTDNTAFHPRRIFYFYQKP